MIRIRPIELRDANAFVAKHHRHHKPIQGHRWSLAAYSGDRLCGVAIVGRPVARNAGHPLEVCEVSRLCTDGTKNACSALYAAAARMADAAGYQRIQTYILDTEPGTSLKASGWSDEGPAGGKQWKRCGDWSNQDQAVLFQRNRTDQPVCTKRRWSRVFKADPRVDAKT